MKITNTVDVTLPIDSALNACIIEDEIIKNKSDLEVLKESLKSKLFQLIGNTVLYNVLAGNIQICVSKDELSSAIEIVDAMTTMNSGDQFSNFMEGEQVALNDGGALFNTFKQNNLLNDTVLPFHEHEKLPGISDASMQTGKIFNKVLFGVYKGTDGQIHSWFQIETSLYKMTRKDPDPYDTLLSGDIDLIPLEEMQEAEEDEELAPTEEHTQHQTEHGHTTGDHGHAAGDHGEAGHFSDEVHIVYHHVSSHGDDEHEHKEGDHSHVEGEHGHKDGEHEHKEGEHAHAEGEHAHPTDGHGHSEGGHSDGHGHSEGDHGHSEGRQSDGHGHSEGDHGHSEGGHSDGHGHSEGDHGHSEGHVHAEEGHGHTDSHVHAEDHRRSAGDHAHTAEEHGHATGEHGHAAAVKNKDPSTQLHH